MANNKLNTHFRKSLAITAILSSVSSFALQAHAQNNSILLDEIIVTAQKKSENAQDVGIAITAFSGDQLEKLGIEDSTEIAKFTPSVSISGSFAGQQQQYSIRGVTQNDFNDHVEAPNAVYIDEGYVAAQQGSIFATFDVERVEVLKGPQGTLFGRNATGGLVHFLTRKPTEEFEGYVSARYASYNQIRLEGAVGGPISDKINYRISGLFNTYDGYLKNDYPEQTYTQGGFVLSDAPQLPGAGADLGGDKTIALRAHLDIETGAESSLLLTGFYSDSTQSTAPYQSSPTIATLDASGQHIATTRVSPTETREVIGPNGIGLDNTFDGDTDGVRPRAGGDFFGYIDPDGNDFRTSSNFAFDDVGFNKNYGGTANWNIAFGDLDFTSITDFKKTDKFQVLDLEAGPADQFFWFGEASVDSFTQEFRLAGNGEKFDWVTGLFLLDINAFGASAFGAVESSFFNGFGGVWDFPRIVDLKTRSYSAFGQFEYSLSDTLKVTAGLRATVEEKDYKFDIKFIPNGPNLLGWDLDAPDVPSFGRSFVGDKSDTLWTGKLQLDWTPTDDLLVYAGFNRGVKAGSFNATGDTTGTLITDAQIPYDAETLHAFELGFKSTIFGGNARLNGAAYYYDYKDYQAARWNGLGSEIFNNDSVVKGVEFDLRASPIDYLDISIGYGYIDAVVKDVLIAGTLFDVRPTFSPEHTFSALARYAVPNVVGGELSFQGSVSYQSEIYHNLETPV